MIISASRRTDVPCYYGEWFFRRLREGFVCVRNPMNFHQVSRISLGPEALDGIVFWSKNPLPMAHRLGELGELPYYLQITLTPYGPEVEPGLPDKAAVLIPGLQALARQIGPERIIWRYDPILLTGTYTEEFHLEAFRHMAARLRGCTGRCVISFVDLYQSTLRHGGGLGLRPISLEEMLRLAGRLAEIAEKNTMRMTSCSEAVDLSSVGIAHGQCIDRQLLEQLAGYPLELRQDPHQRGACGCVESIDIGMYDTCRSGCKYCYATHSHGRLTQNLADHDPDSPLLCGRLLPEDRVTERAVRSHRSGQLRFL